MGAAAEASNGVVFSMFEDERVLFWPFDTTLGPESSLYEYRGTGNTTPSLVLVSGGAGSTELISQCGTRLGNGGRGERETISEDGSVVFFMAVGADSDVAVVCSLR